MKKHYHDSRTIKLPFEEVWIKLSNPSKIVMEKISHYDLESPTKWVDHTSNNVDNVYEAVINQDDHTVCIDCVNSKYSSETGHIELSIEKQDDDNTVLNITYIVGTTAIFNIIALWLFGKKIGNHMIHNIEKNILRK